MLKRIYFILTGIALVGMPLSAAHAQASPTVSISVNPFSSNNNITVGTVFAFQISISGFTQPTYAIGDSFSGSSISGGDVTYNGQFSWTPVAADVGYHVLHITATDVNGDSASIVENVTVAAVGSVSMLSISPGSSVTAGTHVGFSVQANGFTPPIFTASDSFSGTSVTSENVDQNGYFSWTPDASQVGPHLITIRVDDYNNHHGSIQQQIIVSGSGVISRVTPPVPEYMPVTAPVSSVATTNTSAVFTRNLTVGGSGTDVAALQQRLLADGLYSGPVTGYYGTLTAAAVAKYQTKHGLSAVGSVGPQTRALLNQGI